MCQNLWSKGQTYLCSQLSKAELDGKCFHVKYSCAKDEYSRDVDGKVGKGFQNMLAKCDNVFRKVEQDWKMTYLARTEGIAAAEVEWKFDFVG